MIKEELKDRVARAEEIQQYTENRCEALEKENAELKEKLGNIQMQKAGEKSDLVWKLKTANEQKTDKLTKATEIIRGLLSCLYSVEYDRVSDLEQAEQFLKETDNG